MLLSNQSGAVDATPKLFYLVGGQVVTGHELLVSVTAAAGRRDIARRDGAGWFIRWEDAVHGMAVRAHGYLSVANCQKQAVLGGRVLVILISGEAVWLHEVGIRVARGAELHDARPRWFANVSPLNRMRLQIHHLRLPPMTGGTGKRLGMGAASVFHLDIAVADRT
jgi:hypothetical protein